MEQEDLELEQRVWQRIGGGEEAGQGNVDLHGMMLQAEQIAGVFQDQARNAGGNRREILMELHRHSAGNANALRGMLHMDGRELRQPRAWGASRDPGALPRAYRSLQRQREDFERHSGHREYGPVFRVMERTAGEDLHKLLGLIGNDRR